MNDIVYQVKSHLEMSNLLALDAPHKVHEFDHGIFKTESAAISFIEECVDKYLAGVLEGGDWAWIDAHSAEPIEISNLTDKEEFFVKGVLTYCRNNANVDRRNYYIATRIIKE